MLAESSRHQSTPPGAGRLEQASHTDFRHKLPAEATAFGDQYHHAALLLPEAERDQAFQRLRALETGTMTATVHATPMRDSFVLNPIEKGRRHEATTHRRVLMTLSLPS